MIKSYSQTRQGSLASHLDDNHYLLSRRGRLAPQRARIHRTVLFDGAQNRACSQERPPRHSYSHVSRRLTHQAAHTR
jgi:hypothetical protein